ncbi:MAG: serine hydrolase domain-containing protein, partial [Maribacter sp.]
MMYRLFIVFMLGAVLTSTYAQEKDAPANTLTKKLDSIRQQGHINGFSVAIVNQNGTLYTHGFGFADVKENEQYTENTLQNIGSISKTFIGVALLKAQELGELNLDDPINKYLPFEVIHPYFPNDPISIRQLATHTSGLKDPSVYEKHGYVLKEAKRPGTKVNSNFRPPEDLVSMQAFLEAIYHRKGKWYKKSNFLKKKPGETFEYSNLGAGLAAYIIERG